MRKMLYAVLVMVWMMAVLLAAQPALARHHKKKATPTATPTTSSRLSNPVESPDPPAINWLREPPKGRE
jgi:hypothetical protein